MFDQYYGLSANPFQLTPDPRFYFESATHRKALSYLGYGLAQGEGFIVITGEIGSGKTTLVGHLMATIDRSRLTAATIVTSALDGEDMVEMAAESFGIPTGDIDKAGALKAIETFLHEEARAGRRCLLVVDEAQNLSVGALEELRMLSNFQLGGQALLQIFLLGQPEFRERVEGEPRLEQLRQRIIATHHLDAMEAEEVEPYIIHRLSKVGWNGRPDITPDCIARLYDETGGVPRRLNRLLSRLLLSGAVEQTDCLDAALLGRVLADQFGDGPATLAPEPRHQEWRAHGDADDPFAVTHWSSGRADRDAPAPRGRDEDDAPAMRAEPAHRWPPRGTEHLAAEKVDEDNVDELKQQLAALEKRVTVQEDAIKQVLSMLVHWAEEGAPPRGGSRAA